MSKEKPGEEKRTNPANETQKLTDKRKMPRGADKRGGQSPK